MSSKKKREGKEGGERRRTGKGEEKEGGEREERGRREGGEREERGRREGGEREERGRREGGEREEAQARAAGAHTYLKSRRKGKIKKEGERGEARALLLLHRVGARAAPTLRCTAAAHLHHLRLRLGIPF